MMKLLASPFLLLLPLMLVLMVSSSPNPGVARSHGDQHRAPRRWLLEDGQECECKDWFLQVPKRKTTAALGPPRKQCPCDHVKGSEKKTRHRKHHGKSQRLSRACQQFLKQCQLASFVLPL
ncbi:C-X-C motif chemokine 17 [Grammomys surdaster]|uniref:C-X-C motif chemokine 17 n=1 Tax=Grammomys surdaster TaxID=491861 RepID=UPI0010A0A017|nr:C-X-C motif chemokine 17 [Grammomys surdaster]